MTNNLDLYAQIAALENTLANARHWYAQDLRAKDEQLRLANGKIDRLVAELEYKQSVIDRLLKPPQVNLDIRQDEI